MISVTEAAALLGVSPQRVRVLCAQGRIKGARKVGPRLWVMPDTLRVQTTAESKIARGARISAATDKSG